MTDREKIHEWISELIEKWDNEPGVILSEMLAEFFEIRLRDCAERAWRAGVIYADASRELVSPENRNLRAELGVPENFPLVRDPEER